MSRHSQQSTYQAKGHEFSRQSRRRLLIEQTRHLGEVLKSRRLSARFVIGSETLVVGCGTLDPGRSVGFVFGSDLEFRKALQRNRLIDFAHAYISGAVSIDGDIRDAAVVLDALNEVGDRKQTAIETALSCVSRYFRAVIPNIAWRFESLEHYRQSAHAYELFLDKWMQYTCGMFALGDETITEAQEAKFSFIRDLATSHIGQDIAGKRHLDIGCGWGGLLAYFERAFGTNSVGITNTPQQADYARRRFGVNVREGDFESLTYTDERFDLITIIGMIEHLSPRRRDRLLRVARDLLTDRGVLYLQCIGKPRDWIGGDCYRVAQELVFPGHYVEYDHELRNRIENADLEIMQSFEHVDDYAKTTDRWIEAIQENLVKIEKLIGAKQTRIMLGYLAFANMLFSERRGSLQRIIIRRR